MVITFSNNPFVRFECWLENTWEDISQHIWNRKPYKVKCCICGDVIRSKEEKYSPEQCGWKRVGGWHWICHKCLYHRNFKLLVKQADLNEEKSWEIESNPTFI